MSLVFFYYLFFFCRSLVGQQHCILIETKDWKTQKRYSHTILPFYISKKTNTPAFTLHWNYSIPVKSGNNRTQFIEEIDKLHSRINLSDAFFRWSFNVKNKISSMREFFFYVSFVILSHSSTKLIKICWNLNLNVKELHIYSLILLH